MMNLPTPSSRTDSSRRTHGFARGADVRRHRSSERSRRLRSSSSRAPRPRASRVVAQTAADRVRGARHALSSRAVRHRRGRGLHAPGKHSGLLPGHVAAGACSPCRAAAGPAPPPGRADKSRPAIMWSASSRATPSRSTTRPRSRTRSRSTASSRSPPTVNTRLKVTNLQVMAGDMGMGTPGVLEVGTAASADRRRRDGRDRHRQFAARRQRRRPRSVRHRAHRARQGVDARQREDADVRAPRHRAARGPHDVDAVGGGLGMEGRRPARPAGHAAHQGKRSDRRRLDQRRQPVGRAHRAGHLGGRPDRSRSTARCSTTTWARAI